MRSTALLRFSVRARLLALACSLAPIGAWGCKTDEGDSAAPKARSEAVVGASKPNVAASSTDEVEAPSEGQPAVSGDEPAGRVLCQEDWDEEPETFDPPGISRASADGHELPPEAMPRTGGLTWVNFWAAWCKPCKEEIPRLVGWEEKLGEEGLAFRLVFVSLDDDSRQLDGFIEDQPDTGVKQTYWLQDGPQRAKWLKEAGLETDPELPIHLLLDARGRIRCRITGAVEDEDFARVRTLAKSVGSAL